MSWKDDLLKELEITTGDGATYKPFWRVQDAELSTEFNTSITDFIDVEKSFVDKRKLKSKRLNLVLYFQGDNCISEAKQFEISSVNPNFWTLNHPFYGVIYGQPLSIAYSNTSLNTSVVTVDFVETITDMPNVELSIELALENEYGNLENNCEMDYTIDSELEKKGLIETLNSVGDKYKTLFYSDQFQEFQEKFQEVSKSIDSVISLPQNYIKEMYNFMGFITQSKTNVFLKIDSLKDIFSELMVGSTSKKHKESIVASVIANTAIVSAQIDSKSLTRLEIISIQDSILQMYFEYESLLEDDQQRGDYAIQNTLYTIVVTSVYNLFNITYDAKQEREIILQNDSNIIILTSELFGLDSLDENINTFRKVNNIKNNSLIQIKKGTKIKYYI